MRFIKILVMLFCIWTGNADAASYTQMQQQCRQRMQDNPPQITVEYSFGKLNFDTTKTADELIKLAREYNPDTKADGKIQGLTGLKFATHLNVETLTEEIGSNDVCVIPQKVHLKLYYEKPTIYLINTLKPDTCRYNLVLRHEYTHLDIGHLALQELAHKLKQKLLSVIEQRGSKVVLKNIYLQDSSAIMQKFLQEYELGLRSLMNSHKTKLLEEQAQLDTPENYQRETKLCPNVKESSSD